MEPYKLPKMTSKEIEMLIDKEKICRIAFKGDDFPYLAPFQYVKIGDALFFHFTDYGRKKRLIERDKKVCVGIERFEPDMREYSFVVLHGELEKVDNEDERADAIRALAEFGRKMFSENFLAAHGFKTSQGWEILSEDKPMVIFKLGKITNIIGLKSPPTIDS
jgi:nitroimidazol reductase NimA-like FMN-containing flavoprotein (pyridoxamine 5'-phosphate oxidase superfamily)